MSPTERERIEKEAEEYIKKSRWMESWKTTESKLAYIAGAESEHDKARNQAIDEVIQLVTCNKFNLTTDMVFALESLKTIS